MHYGKAVWIREVLAEKQEAKHAAWSAPGITAVENHIEVEP